jgi:hypothetical protein
MMDWLIDLLRDSSFHSLRQAQNRRNDNMGDSRLPSPVSRLLSPGSPSPISNLQFHYVLIFQNMVSADHLALKIRTCPPDPGRF